MAKFTKKPVTIDAVVWTGSNVEEIAEFVGPHGLMRDFTLIIKTLEGEHIATEGDYIIKGVKGEFYPCKADIFAMTYEAASPETEPSE